MNTDRKTFTLELREAAMVERNTDLRYALRASADLVDACIDNLDELRTAEAMIDLNGAWAYAWKILQLHREPKKPTPPRADAAREEKKAA